MCIMTNVHANHTLVRVPLSKPLVQILELHFLLPLSPPFHCSLPKNKHSQKDADITSRSEAISLFVRFR